METKLIWMIESVAGKEMIMRYFCTNELIEKDGKFYHHRDKCWLSDKQDGKINIDMHRFPEIFLKNGEYNRGGFFRGTLGFPAYYFEDETLTYTETWKEPWARRTIRRHIINSDLNFSLRAQTELKKTRKAILAILNHIPELESLEPIKEYLDMSDYIEDKIAIHTKDTDESEAEAIEYNESDPWLMYETEEGEIDE